MICVSIGRTRHKMMTLEHQALAERGAELVEFRLDWLSRAPDLTRLLADRPTPCVITLRRQQDRGRWRGSEEQRLAILRAAIVAKVEYVDLEDEIAGTIRRYGPTKRIISHHNFEETPEDLEETYERLCKLDPDIVKLVTMANTPGDAVRMLQLVQSAKTPTIGFCMGELGLLSRILCGKYGAPFTYASFSSERELAPGQISFDQMRKLYHYERIDKDTNIYGVLGDPIAHSMSPLIYNATFRHENINGVYIPFRVLKQTLPETLAEFEWLNVRGYSVTIPHKEAVLEEFPRHDAAVEEIGAANTLYRDYGGEWNASNTDYEAALSTIRLGLQEGGNRDAELSGRKVLVLGAGGVSKAICLGLVKAGAGVTICSRTHARAIALAEKLGCQQTQWENRGAVYADILVNCTPVGMHPNMDESPFAMNWFRDGMLVFDTIYNPENTLLLKEARQHNCRTISGVEMFIRQAALQYERFVNQAAPIDMMRKTFRDGISAVRES